MEGERKNKSYSNPKEKSISKEGLRKKKVISLDKISEIKKSEEKELKLL
jgi:hypothetical protein